MPVNPHRCRPGFTLIELLVVIAIIAVLIGLILPAVSRVRQAAFRIQTNNNLKQIGLAVHSLGAVRGDLPPGYGPMTGKTGSCFFHLLPYLEQQGMYDQGIPGMVPTYQIPLDPTAQTQKGPVGSIGANGQVFVPTSQKLVSSMPDGMSNVILFSTIAQTCNVTETKMVHTGEYIYDWRGTFVLESPTGGERPPGSLSGDWKLESREVPTGIYEYEWEGTFGYITGESTTQESPSSPEGAISGSWVEYRRSVQKGSIFNRYYVYYYWYVGYFTFRTKTRGRSPSAPSAWGPLGGSWTLLSSRELTTTENFFTGTFEFASRHVGTTPIRPDYPGYKITSGDWRLENTTPVMVSQSMTNAVVADWTARMGRHLVVDVHSPAWGVSSIENCNPNGWNAFDSSGISVCMGDGSVRTISREVASQTASGKRTTSNWEAAIRPRDGVNASNW